MESPEIVRRIAEMTEHLEPMPQIAAKVMEIVGDPDATCEILSGVISRDPALASKILSLSNTPYYRRVESITSLNMAVMILGFGTIQSLVLTISVGIIFGRSMTRQTILRIWEHSVATALISEILGKRLGLPEQERFYIAGLLHDVGKLVFCKSFPEKFKETAKRSKLEGVPGYEAERMEFGFDHAQLGQAVLEKWNLPEVYSVPVANHHQVGVSETDDMISPLVHVADGMAHDILESERETGWSTDPVAFERLRLEVSTVTEWVSQERDVIGENLELIARL